MLLGLTGRHVARAKMGTIRRSSPGRVLHVQHRKNQPIYNFQPIPHEKLHKCQECARFCPVQAAMLVAARQRALQIMRCVNVPSLLPA